MTGTKNCKHKSQIIQKKAFCCIIFTKTNKTMVSTFSFFKACVLTNIPFNEHTRPTIEFPGLIVEYESEYVGRVRIRFNDCGNLINSNDIRFKNKLAAICKYHSLHNETPFEMSSRIIKGDYILYEPPIEFFDEYFKLLNSSHRL